MALRKAVSTCNLIGQAMGANQYTTYKSERVNFLGNPEQRTGAVTTKDQQFINFFPELLNAPISNANHYFLQQRGGLVYNLSTATGAGRGVYYYNGSIFSVVGNQLYRNSTAIQTLSTSTGTIGFQEYAGVLKYLIVLDGTSGWVINSSNVVTQITDPDFPTPHVVQAAYMDGYIFVAKSGTDDIYNCVLEDPFTWSTGDFITAEMFPDTIVALCRQNNYVVAIGQQTIEYFYDTGVFPGTPLARNAAALHQIGSPAPDSLSQIEEQVIFVGQTAAGGRTVWVMNGFNPTEISIEPVRTSLDNEGTNISTAKAFCIRNKGHRFYVINLTSMTWVYDFDERMWHQWTNYNGTAKFNCDFASDYTTGSPLMQDRTTGYVYTMNGQVSTDATGVATVANVTSVAVSSKLDFGTMDRKFMHRMTLLCDVPAASSATSCSLQWSDDDYQTWTTARTITIDDTMPTITQLGPFRRRAFKLTYSQPYPMRLEGFEVDLNTGSQ